VPNDEGHDLIAELPDDGSQQHVVYARFGLAVYFGQVLEHGLANLIVVAERLTGQIVDEESWESRYDALFSKTAGGLVRLIADQSHLAAEGIELCRRAVKRRNWLTHHYFREHVLDSMTTEGRQRMVDTADDARRLFMRADAACEEVVNQLLAKAGVTEDQIEAEALRLLAEAGAADSG